MGIIEFYLSLNLFWKILIGAWAVEVLILPFRFNLFFRDVKQWMDQLIQATKTNKENFESDERVLSLLLRILTASRDNEKYETDSKGD